MRRVALAAVLALSTLVAPENAAAQESHFSAAVRLVGEGDYRRALDEALQETAQPDAAQARLHVWHHAGALEEALAAGLEGLEAVPTDPWLLDRCAYLSISLGEGERALELCSRLRAATAEQGWEASAWMLEEAEQLAARGRDRTRGQRRARWTVLVALALFLAATAWLARPESRSRG